MPDRRRPQPRTFLAGLLLAAPLLLPPAAAGADAPEAFEARVRDYLLAHPEIVVEALERYRASRREVLRAVETNPVIARSASLFDDEDDPWLGNPEGDVTLVAFTDYGSDACRRMGPVLARLLERDPGLRLVFKPLPGTGEGPYLAALAALAARAQGRFAALHEALMNLPGGRLDEAEVFRVAAHVDLDLDRLRRDMGDPALGARLQRNERLADALGIAGAPALVVGTEVAEGARDLAALEVLVARARLP